MSKGHDLVRTSWRKSSYSNGSGGDCVEVATPAHALLVRDSKRPTGPTLTFHHPTWHTFLTQLREAGRVRG
ncbi:DUF397 domain-containing protein [Streptomyces oceani]|uniref:DUF397 domain-containing protein n=1 Tax=Streptomyces oceani TaxID=1075402 RepID=A0A1E7JXS1_9ACTN|nr:DUF397 domain-containing protein [Streptomyces oceani]OEU96411.1 hypothetical protein AN216_20740 [Streptomyces oceani]